MIVIWACVVVWEQYPLLERITVGAFVGFQIFLGGYATVTGGYMGAFGYAYPQGVPWV